MQIPPKIYSDQFKSTLHLYFENCFGADYLHPLSRTCQNTSNLGITIFSALDTALVFQEKEIYHRLFSWLKTHFSLQQDRMVPFQELCQDVIGGLLSAYTLTHDPIYLKKLKEVGEIALQAFEPGPIPHRFINPSTGQTSDGFMPGKVSLAEASCFIFEFKSLSIILKDKRYLQKVDDFLKCIGIRFHPFWSTSTCQGEQEAVEWYTPQTFDYIYTLLKLHWISPSLYSRQLIHTLGEEIDRKPEGNTRLFGKLCGISHLLDHLNVLPTFSSIINGDCQMILNKTLPVTSWVYVPAYYSGNWTAFDFNQIYLEMELLFAGDLKSVPFLSTIPLTFLDQFSALSSQSPILHRDFLPPKGISSWLKYLALQKWDVPPQAKKQFVMNDAGHILPLIDISLFE